MCIYEWIIYRWKNSLEIITWSEIGKQTTQAKKVFQPVVASCLKLFGRLGLTFLGYSMEESGSEWNCSSCKGSISPYWSLVLRGLTIVIILIKLSETCTSVVFSVTKKINSESCVPLLHPEYIYIYLPVQSLRGRWTFDQN